MRHPRENLRILQLCHRNAPAQPSPLVSERSCSICNLAAGGHLASGFTSRQRRACICRSGPIAGPRAWPALARPTSDRALRCPGGSQWRWFGIRALFVRCHAQSCTCAAATVGRSECHYPVYQRPYRTTSKPFAQPVGPAAMAGRIVRSLDSPPGSVREGTALYRAKSGKSQVRENSRRLALFQCQYSNHKKSHRLKPVLQASACDARLK